MDHAARRISLRGPDEPDAGSGPSTYANTDCAGSLCVVAANNEDDEWFLQVLNGKSSSGLKR